MPIPPGQTIQGPELPVGAGAKLEHVAIAPGGQTGIVGTP